MEAPVVSVQETVVETLVIEGTDPVTTVNAFVILFPAARFERVSSVVTVTASVADLERMRALLAELAARAR